MLDTVAFCSENAERERNRRESGGERDGNLDATEKTHDTHGANSLQVTRLVFHMRNARVRILRFPRAGVPYRQLDRSHDERFFSHSDQTDRVLPYKVIELEALCNNDARIVLR